MPMPKEVNIYHQKVLIRSFRDADQRAAKDLIILGLAEHFVCIDSALNPDIDNITTHYLQKGDVFIVAELGDRLVATLGLIYVNHYQAKIVRMSVLKGYRRQGIARSLLEYCINLALDLPLQQLMVSTEHSWTAAINLYREHGFVTFDRDRIDVHMKLNLHEINSTR